MSLKSSGYIYTTKKLRKSYNFTAKSYEKTYDERKFLCGNFPVDPFIFLSKSFWLVNAGKTNWRGRLSTVDLLVETSLDQLL